MTKLRRLFTEHPATVGETYTQHLVSAAGFSARMMIGSICCLVHALLPFLFQTKGSGIIEGLYSAMITNRHRTVRVDDNKVSDHPIDEPQPASHGLT